MGIMNYQQFKAIEQYFRLGELIEEEQEKLNALSRIKQGFLSLNDLRVVRNELVSFGLFDNEHLDLDELYSSLVDEVEQLREARKDLKEISYNLDLDIDQLIFQKKYYESEHMFESNM